MPGVQQPRKGDNTGYLSELLGRRPLRQVRLRFAARALVVLFVEHGGVLGEGPVEVRGKQLNQQPLENGRHGPDCMGRRGPRGQVEGPRH